MSENNTFIGTTQIAGGVGLAYEGLKHGLPRALGIRTEFHTTDKNHAAAIKKSGNFLDPAYGGSGFSAQSGREGYISSSKNYVHITGINKDSNIFNHLRPNFSGKLEFLRPLIKTYVRKFMTLGYKCYGNSQKSDIPTKCSTLYKNIFGNKTKTFYIPGIDSYFDKNFITDPDDFSGLKTTQKLKVYNNRFSSMIGGLKEFGLKGMKENKTRVGAGLAIVGTTLYGAYKLINKGINYFN